MGSAGNWKELAQICINIQQNSIPKQWMLSKDKLPPADKLNVLSVPYEAGILSSEELEITEQDASSLLKAYASGKWTVKQVVTAFLKRCTIMHQLTNFATEFLAESALQRADELDAHFKETGKLFGALHGIPVSIKEHISMGGRITHASFVSKITNVAKEDALSVKLLKEAGAVIHVRTNQPQSIMHLDCDNNITGMTLNPLNLKLSPGGSSGGEGASVGSKSSVIGVGTDIGGSVRCPAAFCGTYGFRPTALRIPNLGHMGITAGQESIRGVQGPFGQSVEDLELFMSSILDRQPWDVQTELVPLEWRRVKPSKEITIGVMLDDGLVKPHPPVIRALKTAAQKLENAGIKMVNWEPYDHGCGWDIVSALYFPQGPKPYLDEFHKTGEPVLPLTTHAFSYSAAESITIADNWRLNYERETYRREHHRLMKERGVDFILCPAYVGAGVLQGLARYWGYTSIWNILDLPASVFPTGVRVDKAVDVVEEGYHPRSADDKAEWKAYDPVLFHDVPVCLQLAGKHFRDEEVLAASKLVDQILKS